MKGKSIDGLCGLKYNAKSVKEKSIDGFRDPAVRALCLPAIAICLVMSQNLFKCHTFPRSWTGLETPAHAHCKNKVQNPNRCPLQKQSTKPQPVPAVKTKYKTPTGTHCKNKVQGVGDWRSSLCAVLR